jgi:hypothetical protein
VKLPAPSAKAIFGSTAFKEVTVSDNPQIKIEIPIGFGGRSLIVGLYTTAAMVVAAATIVGALSLLLVAHAF